MDKLFCSFSGGRSSAFMAKTLKQEYGNIYDIRFGFANTGQENEQTLIFVDKCDKYFGLDLVWLEAVTHPGKRIGCTHRIVTFETASRKEEPFREMIAKYGIPNDAYPHCTRELKLNPIRSFLESVGWHTGQYVTALGIRSDEPKRIKSYINRPEIILPLALMFPMTKPAINDWWEEQPFNLDLQEHQGNCKTCWKKSTVKLVRIAQETPDAFAFNAEMESQHGLSGHNVDGTKRVFFRQHMSTQTILHLAQIGALPPNPSDSDLDSGCSESCEVFQ